MKINEELKKEYPWRERWNYRAGVAVNKIYDDSSIIDLGGGFGEVYQAMGGKCEYVSIDLKPWTDLTVVADFNKGEFPDVKKADFVVCLGVIEYIEKPFYFLKKIHKYGNRMVISYREKSCGGMDRKNNLSYMEFREILESAGWHILSEDRVRNSEIIFRLKCV